MIEPDETPFDRLLYWGSLVLLILIPLAFSTTVYRIFALPKFIVLTVGSALLASALALQAIRKRQAQALFTTVFDKKHLTLAALYLVANLVSAILGVSPVASIFGSFENQMGMVTRLRFFICFISLCVGIRNSLAKLQGALWAVSITGLLVSAYAIVQFFGKDPFLPDSLYAFETLQGTILRVISSIGHSNYLGNFLLYTTPVSFALALTVRGRERRILIAGSFLSVSAIVISGTRGAWLGLLVAVASFFALEYAAKVPFFFKQKRKALVYLGVLLVAGGSLIWIASSSRYANTAWARLLATRTENFSGSGRTLLWRDSLKMVPRYAIIGCGAEGFLKAFPPYRSKALAQLASNISNESPHNAYLDALISSGLVGGLAYLLLIVSSLLLLICARRETKDERLRIISSGLMAALVGVATHNFFIFDQITTGLYFFAFAALAQVACNVARQPVASAAPTDRAKPKPSDQVSTFKNPMNRALAYLGLAISISLLGLTLWYSYRLIRLDVNLRQAAQASGEGNLEQLVKQDSFFDANADAGRTHNFLYAQMLVPVVDSLKPKSKSGSAPVPEPEEIKALRYRLIDLAIKHTERSRPYALSPASINLLLGYLFNSRGAVDETESYAVKALIYDPYSANAHWLLATAKLAQGDKETAKQEAAQSLEIDPNLAEARQVLRQAKGVSGNGTADEVAGRALVAAEQGNLKARRLALHAKRLAPGPCAICDQAIAVIEAREKR